MNQRLDKIYETKVFENSQRANKFQDRRFSQFSLTKKLVISISGFKPVLHKYIT